MSKKRPAPLRDELPDGSRIERNYRLDDDGNRVPYGSWYWAVYDPDRRPSRKRLNLRTQDRGVALLKAAEHAKGYGMRTFDPWTQGTTHSGITIDKAADGFLKAQEQAGKSAATVAWDSALLKRFDTHLPAGVLIGHVERHHVESFVNARKPVPKSKKGKKRLGDERSPSTKARILATLRHFFGWAAANRLVQTDPTTDIKLAERRGTRRDHITIEEEEAILTAIAKSEAETGANRDWLRDWVVFGTHTGLRPSEQHKLRWSAIHLAERTVQIGEGHAVKTPASRRTVPVEGAAYEVLQRRHQKHGDGPNGLVFTGADGGPVNTQYLAKALRKVAEAAGVQKNVVPYSIRHAFGTRAALGGVPLYHIAKLMGTSVAMVEKHYAHYSPDSGAGYLRRLFGSGDGSTSRARSPEGNAS